MPLTTPRMVKPFMRDFHGFDRHLVRIRLQICGLHLFRPRILQLPRDDRLVVFVEQLDGDGAPILAPGLVAFLEVVGFLPEVEEFEVPFESAALEGDVTVFGKPGLFALVVFLAAAFAIFDDFSFEIQSADFRETDAEAFAPFY